MPDELQRFLEACDPAAPAGGVPRRSLRFVDRKDGFRAELAVRLGQKGARVLCVGQTGIGKSTELLIAAEELEPECAVVAPPVDRVLDLGLLGWRDLMVFGCLWAAARYSTIEDSSSALRLIQLVGGQRNVWDPDYEGLSPDPGGHLRFAPGRAPKQGSLEGFRNEHARIREKVARASAQVADLCRQVVAEVENKTGKPLIVLLDGVEKVTIKVAKNLFFEEARLAFDLPFRAAVVAPHGILHQDYSADLADFFSSEPLILRAVSCQDDEPEGREFFREMLRTRGGTDLIEPEALDLAIDASGGVPRQLLTIVSNAARLAIAEETDLIASDLMLRGRERAMERFFYALRDEDYHNLAEFSEDQPPGPRLERLLRLLAVIEYGKVGALPRLGINPLCRPLLKRYEAAHAMPGRVPDEAR